MIVTINTEETSGLIFGMCFYLFYAFISYIIKIIYAIKIVDIYIGSQDEKNDVYKLIEIDENCSDVGELSCFVGPMFSGKTTQMLSCVTRYADASNSKFKPLIINHSFDIDRKAGNGDTQLDISSHSSQHFGVSDKILTTYTTKLKNVDVSKHDVIGIDECQFYPDLYETVKLWLSKGKHIYCSGLDGCSNVENFGELHKLLPLSTVFTKLTAVCHICMKNCEDKVVTPNSFVKAPFTSKIGGNKNQRIDVGSEDLYIPTCPKHHNMFLK